jgi:hypothetical protein
MENSFYWEFLLAGRNAVYKVVVIPFAILEIRANYRRAVFRWPLIFASEK